MAVVSAGMGAMSSLLSKLSALLSDEYKLLKRVRKDVEFLKRELSTMEALLQTLAGMDKLEALHKKWRNNVRELSYDIEDCIDRFMRHLGSGAADAGFMKKAVRQLKELRTRHYIASQIKELKVRVLEEGKRRYRYELDSSISRPITVDIDPRLPALYAEAKGLVAIDGPRDQIVGWLMDETVAELKVVSIVGCGGLGKTTLAMEVYRKIEENFRCRASVSVSRTLDLNKLLKDILSQIDEDEYRKCQSEMWEKEQLIRKLRHIFTGKRYFIVIDDVWRIQDWKFVESVFPENNNGSRIIVTTRITDVAKSCCSNSGDQLHQMAHLDDVDSRRLFFKRIFHSDNSCPTELEKVSGQILKKCGGLPLAIITIAGLLATKPQNKNEWERLQDSMGTGSSHEDDHSLQGIKDILFLSYCDLPHHLKTCLLYISIYPEDYEIKSKELIWKWIAEGFITKQGRSLEQVATGYFNDLVNRSMIQSSVDYDGSVSCRVHDLVLDLIISLSEEEKFVTVLDGPECNSLPSKIRRLSLQSSDTEHSTILATTESKSHVRSLNVFAALEQIPPLVDFHALRVLDLSRCKWLENKHIKNLGSLFQLRYLHLASEKITELPEEIGNLQYLLTLDLSDCRNITRLPSTIVRLKKLVRLNVNDSVTFRGDEFGSMHDLEELQTVSRCDNPIRLAEELRHLTKLRSLYIESIGSFRMSGDRERFKEVLSSSLSELGRCNLRYLEITNNCLFKNTSCTFPHLQVLKIHCSFPGVPREMASLTNLVKLFIMCENFEDEDLHVLMGLPSLTHLDLHLCHDDGEDIDDGEDTDKMITVGSSGFRLLEEFVCFSGSRTMLVFAPGATPALQRLYIHICERETLSKYCGGAGFGIEHLTKLRHFEVRTHFCDLTPTQGEIRALADAINRETTSHPYRQTLLVEIHANLPGPNNSRRTAHYLPVFLRSRNGGSPYEIVHGKGYMKDWREHGFICSPADYDLSEYFFDESQQDFEQEDDDVDFVEDCDE